MPYPEVRQRLLLRYEAVEKADTPATKADEYVKWLVQAGEYVRACWQSEHHEMSGQPLDENRTWALWDAYCEDDIEDQATRALTEPKNYSRRRALGDWIAVGAIFSPKWLWNGMRWHFVALWSGFIGALGLVLICAFFIFSFQPTARWAASEMRDALDRIAPVETDKTPSGIEQKSSMAETASLAS